MLFAILGLLPVSPLGEGKNQEKSEVNIRTFEGISRIWGEKPKRIEPKFCLVVVGGGSNLTLSH